MYVYIHTYIYRHALQLVIHFSFFPHDDTVISGFPQNGAVASSLLGSKAVIEKSCITTGQSTITNDNIRSFLNRMYCTLKGISEVMNNLDGIRKLSDTEI